MKIKNIPHILSHHQKYFSAIALMLLALPVTQVSARTQKASSTQESRQKQIPIATTVKGTITTPIVWTDNSQSSATQATINLSEPLLYSDGTVALPVGSSIVVEVANFDRSGFVTLNAIAITYKNPLGEFNQFLIPEGSLLIKNKDNHPLKFNTDSNDGDSIVNNFFNEAVQTGVRKLSLPGGLDSAVSRTVRNNSLNSSSNSSAVYSIEEETEVSIYVNSFLNIHPLGARNE